MFYHQQKSTIFCIWIDLYHVKLDTSTCEFFWGIFVIFVAMEIFFWKIGEHLYVTVKKKQHLIVPKSGVFCVKNPNKNFSKIFSGKILAQKKKIAKNKNISLIFWIEPRRVEQAQKRFHRTKTCPCGSIWKYVKIEVFWL